MSENLLQLYKSGYALDANGNESANSDFNIYQALVNVNTLQYTLSGTAPSDRYIRVHEYVDNTWVRQTIVDYGSNLPFSITKSASTNRFLISINKNNSNMALTAYYVFHAAEGEYPINDQAMPILQNGFTEPLPLNRWRIDESNGGYPYHMLMPDILYAEQVGGAFENAASLAAVRVPVSVKTIGATAFKGTALQRVKIAADCTYSDTSFPEGCTIERYDDDRYGQLYDSAGKAVLDYDARRIFVLKEVQNG